MTRKSWSESASTWSPRSTEVIQRTDESGEKKSAWARRHTELSLQLELPAEIDSTKANGEVKNGVLTIHLPKTEQARQRTRKIPVRA